MVDLGKKAYIKQSFLFFQNNDNDAAYRFGKEFTEKFPEEMVAHFILAKSAYWLGKFDESALEARKAFNLSSTPDDMAKCTILTASAYYELGQLDKAIELLNATGKISANEDIETLLIILYMAKKDEKNAVAHLQTLYDMNRQVAGEVALKLLKGSG